MLVAQLCRLFVTPWTSPPGSPVHEILQARILEWVAISFPGIFPTQGSSPGLLHCRQILYCLSHLKQIDRNTSSACETKQINLLTGLTAVPGTNPLEGFGWQTLSGMLGSGVIPPTLVEVIAQWENACVPRSLSRTMPLASSPHFFRWP